MADLSVFATKDNADEGVVIPVKIDGQKIPLALKIYGSDSDVVKNYERAKLRKLKIGKNGKTDIDEEVFEELLDSQDDAVLIRIGGLWSYDWKKDAVDESDPVKMGETVLGCDRKSYKLLIEKLPALKDWVMEKSNDRNNFLSAGKKN